MSLSKKPQNYSALLGDLKSSINEKIKGRNYKMYMKRVQTNSIDRGDIVGLKTNANIMTNSNFNNERTIMHNDSNSKINLLDKRLIEKRRQIGSSGLDYSTNSMNKKIDVDVGNKIDIKISVNYGKSNTGSTNDINNNLSQMNSLMNSKSKSFYQTVNNPHNTSILNNSHIQATGTITPNYESNTNNNPVLVKDKLIKTLKSNINNDERMIRKKVIENSKQYDINQHKRNQSDNSYCPNNLNISLMNYENKSKIMNYFNTNNMETASHQHNANHSFAYNNSLLNHYKNTGSMLKNEHNSNS
jgi:hypothetical protein